VKLGSYDKLSVRRAGSKSSFDGRLNRNRRRGDSSVLSVASVPSESSVLLVFRASCLGVCQVDLESSSSMQCRTADGDGASSEEKEKTPQKKKAPLQVHKPTNPQINNKSTPHAPLSLLLTPPTAPPSSAFVSRRLTSSRLLQSSPADCRTCNSAALGPGLRRIAPAVLAGVLATGCSPSTTASRELVVDGSVKVSQRNCSAQQLLALPKRAFLTVGG
jgi:hypothetical protein